MFLKRLFSKKNQTQHIQKDSNVKADFKLYHLHSCPYCLYVRRAADELGISLELIDVRRSPDARERLLKERNRSTVPVLDTGAGLLGESKDIVAYLKRWAKQRDTRKSA